MADSRDWEKETGSAAEGSETTKTTITTEKFRAGEEERRHTLDPNRNPADDRRRGGEAGVKSYPAEYASGRSGSGEPGRGTTEDRFGEGSGRFEAQPGGPSMERRPGESYRQSGKYSREGEESSYGRRSERGGESREYGRHASEGRSGFREEAAETGTQMKEQASRMAEEARQRGKGFLEDQKRTAADSLERFASVLHETGERLEDDQPTFSDFFHRGGDSVDRFAGILRERDTETMLNQFQDFARRQPGLLLGGAVAAGFFLSRMLKSTSHRSESAYPEHRSGRSDEEREFFETSDRMRAYREVGQDVPSTTMEEYHGRE
jgi:hypothetical protein